MDKLLEMLSVKEYTSDFNKAFLLKEDQIFSEKDMKEMKVCMEAHYIACNKVMFNGKVKFIYITEKYHTLVNILSQMEKKSFIKCLLQIIQCQSKIKNSQTLEISKLLIDKKYIFWDAEEEQIKMIYLPVENVAVSESDALYNSKCFLKWMVQSVSILDSRTEEDLLSVITDEAVTWGQMYENIFDIFNNTTKTGSDFLKKKEDSRQECSGVNTEKKLILEMTGTKQPVIFKIYKNKEFIIGRSGKSSDGVIPENHAVGRKHCRIRFSQNKYYLEDLGSKNGTFLNGKKVVGRMSEEIAANDIIRLANVEFVAKYLG